MKKNKKINENGTYKEITEINPIPFEDHFNEAMKDPKMRKMFDELEPKYAMLRSIMVKRIEKNISQKALAKRLGTGQSAVSRLERGLHNPSLEYLQKIAKALDSKLVIEFK
ncbi:MAG: helix-turn-helix domain-containing protein [Candidatus Paceibacterota bacterium]|jgi:ribosome-binding protein aMBF1 (putative translation factor)